MQEPFSKVSISSALVLMIDKGASEGMSFRIYKRCSENSAYNFQEAVAFLRIPFLSSDDFQTVSSKGRSDPPRTYLDNLNNCLL